MRTERTEHGEEEEEDEDVEEVRGEEAESKHGLQRADCICLFEFAFLII